MLIPQSNDKFALRYYFIISFLLLICLAIVFRLYDLHILRATDFKDLASRQHHVEIEIKPERGAILDRNGKILATSLKVPSVYAVPRRIPQKEKAPLAKQLAKLLDLEEEKVLSRLKRDKSFVWIKRHVSQEEADQVAKLKNINVDSIYEPKRFYPAGKGFSNLLGLCDIDDNGLDGLELQYNKVLKGRKGLRQAKRDAMGRELVGLDESIVPVINGHKLVLNIDEFIQYTAEKALTKAFQKWKAKGAACVVQDPKTGQILALVSLPNYDPNDIGDEFEEGKRNRAVVDYYEPGSIFKIVLATAALDQGVVTETDKIYCEQGEYRFTRSRILHDVHPYGDLEFKDVMAKSSNIGVVKVAEMLGPEKMYEYIKRFGFGDFTGIDLPGEVGGVIRKPSQWSGYSISSVPIGQEITATAIQMATALSAVANGGILMKPYVVSRVIDEKNVLIQSYEPKKIRRVMTPETSNRVKKILQSVVETGTGKKARIRGVSVGGKTGTAQKILPTGGYSHSDFISSFIGFAPVEDPLLVVNVMVDDPGPAYYGGTVAAPVAREIIQEVLFYMNYFGEEQSKQLKSVA